jgi:hypothetical protein
MKLLDTDKGKFLGVNIIDAFVIFVLLFLVFSFATKLLGEDLVYSGDEMYNAIQGYQKLDSKGFLVEAVVEGKWIVDEQEFYGRGVIIETRSGSFALKKEDGNTVWIGGSMAYLEDIAASKITFTLDDNYVITLPFESREFPSYDEFLKYLEDRKAELGADNLRIGGVTSLPADIAFIRPSKSAQEIFNEFDDTRRIKYYSIMESGKDEAIFRLRLADLEDLKGINVKAEKVVMSKAYVYAGYKEKPTLNIEGEYHIASLEDLL